MIKQLINGIKDGFSQRSYDKKIGLLREKLEKASTAVNNITRDTDVINSYLFQHIVACDSSLIERYLADAEEVIRLCNEALEHSRKVEYSDNIELVDKRCRMRSKVSTVAEQMAIARNAMLNHPF